MFLFVLKEWNLHCMLLKIETLCFKRQNEYMEVFLSVQREKQKKCEQCSQPDHTVLLLTLANLLRQLSCFVSSVNSFWQLYKIQKLNSSSLNINYYSSPF